jgi:tryptophanyl-tRNA synthetase
MLDDPTVITKKIKSAVTDTGRDVVVAEDKPGISNLLGILSAVTGQRIAALEGQFAGAGYGQFKAAVAEAVIAELSPVQERYNALMADPGYVHEAIRKGVDRARTVANETLTRVYDAVGFLPPAGRTHW